MKAVHTHTHTQARQIKEIIKRVLLAVSRWGTPVVFNNLFTRCHGCL